jgi:hypothetical protein
MKLSDTTLMILKNFATINPGLVFKPGNRIRTISSNKAILADAAVDENFPREFALYDLGKLLDVISLHDNPDLDFHENHIEFKAVGGRAKTRVRYSEPKLILSPPNRDLKIPEFDASFVISEEDFKWVDKVSSILKCPYFTVESDGSYIKVNAVDVKGEIVDDASLDLTTNAKGNSFKYVIKNENLKLIPGDYQVDIAPNGIARFTNTTKANVTYYVAVEKNVSEAAE